MSTSADYAAVGGTQSFVSSDSSEFETVVDAHGSRRFRFYTYMCCKTCIPVRRWTVHANPSVVTVERVPVWCNCCDSELTSVGYTSSMSSITVNRCYGRGRFSWLALAIVSMFVALGFALLVTGSAIAGGCVDDDYYGYNDDCQGTGAALYGTGIPLFIFAIVWLIVLACTRPTYLHMSGMDLQTPDLFTLPLADKSQANRIRQVVLDLKYRTDPLVLHNSMKAVMPGGATVHSGPGVPPTAPQAHQPYTAPEGYQEPHSVAPYAPYTSSYGKDA